eukprot:1329180-Amorphochlora_amoeboformis.AAC.1
MCHASDASCIRCVVHQMRRASDASCTTGCVVHKGVMHAGCCASARLIGLVGIDTNIGYAHDDDWYTQRWFRDKKMTFEALPTVTTASPALTPASPALTSCLMS